MPSREFTPQVVTLITPIVHLLDKLSIDPAHFNAQGRLEAIRAGVPYPWRENLEVIPGRRYKLPEDARSYPTKGMACVGGAFDNLGRAIQQNYGNLGSRYRTQTVQACRGCVLYAQAVRTPKMLEMLQYLVDSTQWLANSGLEELQRQILAPRLL